MSPITIAIRVAGQERTIQVADLQDATIEAALRQVGEALQQAQSLVTRDAG